MSAWLSPEPTGWIESVHLALREDVGSGDVSAACLPSDLAVNWMIEAQADGIVCGVGIAEHLLAPEASDPSDFFLRTLISDGEAVAPGTIVVEGRMQAARVLTYERTALNFLMHLGGIATLTGKFVEAVSGTGCRIVDTRKTTPGLRNLQKYAVRCGGGMNHRMGLFDGLMLKDNHVQALGGVQAAVEYARNTAHHLLRIQVECATLDMVQQAVDAGAEVVMLDNMDVDTMREAVVRFGDRVVLEASGGVNLQTVRQIAETGVHVISVGALTHSAPSLSLHLEFL